MSKSRSNANDGDPAVGHDLFEIDPEEILDMEIEMTIVDGKVVCERGADG